MVVLAPINMLHISWHASFQSCFVSVSHQIFTVRKLTPMYVSSMYAWFTGREEGYNAKYLQNVNREPLVSAQPTSTMILSTLNMKPKARTCMILRSIIIADFTA